MQYTIDGRFLQSNQYEHFQDISGVDVTTTTTTISGELTLSGNIYNYDNVTLSGNISNYNNVTLSGILDSIIETTKTNDLVSEVRGQLDSINKNLIPFYENLLSNINSLTKNYQDLYSDKNLKSGQIETIMRDIETNRTNINAQVTQINSIDNKIIGLETKISMITDMQDRNERNNQSTFQGISKDQNNVKTQMTGFQTQITGLQNQVNGLREHILYLERNYGDFINNVKKDGNKLIYNGDPKYKAYTYPTNQPPSNTPNLPNLPRFF